MSLSLGPRKVTGNSTSHEFHNGRQGPKADLATWPDGFKLQGPMDGTTTYAVNIPLDRIISQIMVNMKRWCLLLYGISTRWECHLIPQQLIKTISEESNQILQQN